MKLFTAFERQREIYMNGFAGKKSKVPFHSGLLRQKAKKHTSEKAWAYIDGGASDEITIERNLAAFRNLAIVPRMMRDNSISDFSSVLFDTKLNFPFLLAPIGALDMIHRNADLQIASACENTGMPFVFSNQAGAPMEACAKLMRTTPYWFQLYWSKADDLVLSFVRRAEDCGCKAIVLTVDTTMLGWRARDLALGYLPFLQGLGIAQYTSDAVFRNYVKNGWEESGTAKEQKPVLSFDAIRNAYRLKANFKGSFKDALKSARLFTRIYTNPSLSWEKVAWLKSKTYLPVIIKGILHADDALKAKDAGADGIIVSNHGGRQVDGALSAIEALPAIREKLPKPFKILLDSGIRTGSDAFKAIALGADAVLLGRPYAYGLCIDGQFGVESVIRNFLNDFELTARLSGCRNVAEIEKHSVVKGRIML